MTEAEAMAVAEARWKCRAHRIPEATDEHPQYLFTRDTVEAIGVAHYRALSMNFNPVAGIDLTPQLWERSRFMASALAFVVIVNAPDGIWFATVKDFERDTIAFRPRQLGMDSRAKYVVPRELFKELKPDGAKIGPGSRNE